MRKGSIFWKAVTDFSGEPNLFIFLVIKSKVHLGVKSDMCSDSEIKVSLNLNFDPEGICYTKGDINILSAMYNVANS